MELRGHAAPADEGIGPAGTLDPRPGSPVSLDAPAACPAGVLRGPAILRYAVRHPHARAVALLCGYLAAGVAATWPRATYLAGRLPAIRDTGGYVWGFWWIAHQVIHLANPWFTTGLAAPVGTDLGFHTLMPLPGLAMTPVTLAFGPSASYNLLSAACPGLLCYAMYRAARLWLPGTFDAVVAGGFFGLSSGLTWRSWYELNLALGALFLPLALAAAVRLGRRPGSRRAMVLGLVLGAAVLTDQESAVLAAMLAGLALIPWLVRQPGWARLRQAALAAGTGALVAGPQIAAMVSQQLGGGATQPPHILARNYDGSGASVVQLVAPSPRLASYGWTGLAAPYYAGRPSLVIVGYGAVLTAVGLIGVVAAWRRPAARLLGLLWLGCSLLALGSRPWLLDHGYVPLARLWHGVLMSQIMPYTWFVRLPGLANFREADRFTEPGLLAAALLAGAGVSWLRRNAGPVLAVALAAALLEAGWSGNPPGHWAVPAMATALPALDGPIAADHSRSIVVDIPFGIRGGLPVIGAAFSPETQVLATADGHPLADAWISRIPRSTLAGIKRQPFYTAVLNAQGSRHTSSPALLRAAGRNARAMHIGWVLVWRASRHILRMLRLTGFRFAYRADGVLVYRPAPLTARPGALAAGVAEQAFGDEPPHQPPQARGQARPLLPGQGSQDPGLP